MSSALPVGFEPDTPAGFEPDSLPAGFEPDKKDQAGEDYIKRVEASKKQPPESLPPSEMARTGMLTQEPGEVTGGKEQYDPFTGKVASDKPLASSDDIKAALNLIGERKGVTPSPVQDAMGKAVADRLSAMTTEKFASTLPMYAIPGYAEAQGLEGISQSVPELSQGIKEGDPGKITGGTLDSIMAALMLGHRAIPGGKPADVAPETEVKAGLPKDLQPETPAYRQTPSGPAPIEADLTQKPISKPQDSPQPVVNRGAPMEDVGVVPTASEQEIGVAARYREEQQPGSVEPGTRQDAEYWRTHGRDYINKGGDPRAPIRAAEAGQTSPKGVGIVSAEYERLSEVTQAAANALEASPRDFKAKSALDYASKAQASWSREMQPVFTRAGESLAAIQGKMPVDETTFSGLYSKALEFSGGREPTKGQQIEIFRRSQKVTRAKVSERQSYQKLEKAAPGRAPTDAEMEARVQDITRRLAPCQ